jgi:hypothetical protein
VCPSFPLFSNKNNVQQQQPVKKAPMLLAPGAAAVAPAADYDDAQLRTSLYVHK